MLLKFVSKHFRMAVEVSIWLNFVSFVYIGFSLIGAGLGIAIDNMALGRFLGLVCGVVIGLVIAILTAGPIAVLLNMNKNIARMAAKIVGDVDENLDGGLVEDFDNNTDEVDYDAVNKIYTRIAGGEADFEVCC
jgi:F0F1-type ATP synthase assembly protein I